MSTPEVLIRLRNLNSFAKPEKGCIRKLKQPFLYLFIVVLLPDIVQSGILKDIFSSCILNNFLKDLIGS